MMAMTLRAHCRVNASVRVGGKDSDGTTSDLPCIGKYHVAVKVSVIVRVRGNLHHRTVAVARYGWYRCCCLSSGQVTPKSEHLTPTLTHTLTMRLTL